MKNLPGNLNQVWIPAILISLAGCAYSEKSNSKPSIILILADDMGSHVPGCYGGSKIATPNIDRLAKNGMRFLQAYSGSSVYALSRACLMTGLHSGHVSVRGNTGGVSLKDEDVTVAEILKTAGYVTDGFGKWSLGDVNTEGIPEKQGFDTFFGYYHQIHAHFYYTDYLWRNSVKVQMTNIHGDSASYSPYRIVEEIKKFIYNNNDRRFFCFGSWTIPHTNDDGNPQIPESDPAYQLYKDSSWTEYDKKYAAMNTRLDLDLGAIVTLLKELKIDKQTVIIFISDNGGGEKFDSSFNVSGYLRGFKRQFYEGGIRVALIFSWQSKIPAGSTCSVPCYFPDIMYITCDDFGKDWKVHARWNQFLDFLPVSRTHAYRPWQFILSNEEWENLIKQKGYEYVRDSSQFRVDGTHNPM